MSNDKAPVTIKKYANRRLYNTGTSAYVTLEDLAQMVKRGDDFVVFDAKTNDDITHSVLTQIIFEQEGKNGQSLLPVTFLRQLIRFYGDSMQMLVPSYLEYSLNALAKEKSGLGTLFANEALTSAARPVFAQIEEQTRHNMAMFRQALSLFTPFSGPAPPTTPGAPTPTLKDESAPPSSPAASPSHLPTVTWDGRGVTRGGRPEPHGVRRHAAAARGAATSCRGSGAESVAWAGRRERVAKDPEPLAATPVGSPWDHLPNMLPLKSWNRSP